MTDAIDWLLDGPEPAVARMVRRDLLDEPVDEEAPTDGPWVQALLDGQRADGGFGVLPYKKWTGAHWRLVSLIELEVPPGLPPAMAALETELAFVDGLKPIAQDGRVYTHASIEGNALAVAVRLGLAADPRVQRIAQHLVEWQWPDGGWNCDLRATGARSSFHESWIPMWGLYEYAAAVGEPDCRSAAVRAAELLLDHGLFASRWTGEPINQVWLHPHYPPYWHYDVLHVLVLLGRMGLLEDPRTFPALSNIELSRGWDGRWRSGRWWNAPDAADHPEPVQWNDGGPDRMTTLNAMRVLKDVGRLHVHR